jgi:hypothetical protein
MPKEQKEPGVKVTQTEAEQPQDTSSRTVYLPQVISDEFGTSPSIAREQIMLGMISIDGEEYTGDRLYVPYDEILDKEITVLGRDRSFIMTFKGDQEDFSRR